MDPLERVARVSRLPRPEGGRALLTSPGPGESARYHPLDDRGWVVWLHWTGTRSAPCLDPPEECEHCQAQDLRRLFRVGYVPVLTERGWLPKVLYLTSNALDCSPSLLGSLIEGGLRGKVIRCRREAGGKGRPMFADLEVAERAPPAREGVIDMEAFLRVLFFGAAIRLEARRSQTEGA